uniref:Uncharacterized protein n=1 Tax=Candidatus Kentrum sp. LPFa TaxID=2126335 RepID=A0A450W2Q2_9GAMM|nr:MAG: hypothetical protein BECKLPF1236B_GA0070989_102217 [Candidatus Kentron sp. LPFa]
MGKSGIAKNIAHHSDKPKCTRIANSIINTVGVFSGCQYPLFPKNGKMLRNITLRGSYLIDNIMHTDFAGAQRAEDSKTQRMGNCLHGAGRLLYFILFDHKRLDSGIIHTKESCMEIHRIVSISILENYTIMISATDTPKA